MKKLVVTLLAVLTSGAIQALPVRNPGEASLFYNGICCEGQHCNLCDPCFSWCDAWSLRLGFDGNYVFNRHLEVSAEPQRSMERVSIFTNAGYIALNICDRVDLFATLGATNISILLDTRIVQPTLVVAELGTLTFDSKFSWSVGGRATIWECDCFTVGFEGEYFQTAPRVNYFSSDGIGGSLISLDDDYSARYREWQVALGASYTIATSCPSLALVPYLAVAWSGSRLDGITFVGQPISLLPEQRNRKLWSYAVGTTFTLCNVIGITAEGRFGSEKAVSVNGQFRF